MNQFLFKEWQILLFGFVMCFFSIPGQTVFIALFGGQIRQELSLTNAEFGGIYSLATLLSATLIIWTGTLLDKINLKVFVVSIILILAFGTFMLSNVQTVITLFFAILLLRQAGQGLMTMTASTTTVRYLNNHKGKSNAFVASGYTFAEAVTPALVVLVMVYWGWRNVWLLVGGILIAIVIPLVLLLLKNHGDRHSFYLSSLQENSKKFFQKQQWTRKEVLRDKLFYCIVPCITLSAFGFTGLMFHQIALISFKGWDLTIWSMMLFVYALTSFLFMSIAGVAVDRYGALRFVPFLPVPFGLGLLTLVFFDGAGFGLVMLILVGVTTGFSSVIIAPMFEQLYGGKYLGEIKSMNHFLMVLSSSVSPVLFGLILDTKITFDQLAFGFTVYCFLVSTIAFIGVKSQKR